MTFTGTLYPFQETAKERMIREHKLLLACEMGLGKTPITIAAIEDLVDSEEVGGGFVICPNSLKYQWRRMIDQFTGGEASVIVVNGTPKQRIDQYNRYKAGKAEYLIFNPDQLVNDFDVISRLPRDFIVADEVQWAKNFKPKRAKRLKKLDATYKWGLTGQPVENRAEEVFSIMQWIDEEVLGDYKHFEQAFIQRNHWGGVRFYRNLPTLHRLLSEQMFRKTREEVKDQLPAVVEESILVDFDPANARLYRLMCRELLADLEEALTFFGKNFDLWSFYHGEDDSSQMRGRIMGKLTCLRMLCDAPELLRISAQYFRGDRKSKIRVGSAYANDLDQRDLLNRPYLTPKLDATIELLEDILDASPDNKVVLFSYFTDMLDLIQERTRHLTRSVLFTGKVSAEGRDQAKQIFATDPKCHLLLSSDAGGVGVDLPMANFLISYDLPWGGGAWNQRQSRIIRLSSQFPEVTLISMLMTDSIEERQYDMLAQKQRVADAVIDGRGISPKGRLTLDLQSLGEFLRTR